MSSRGLVSVPVLVLLVLLGACAPSDPLGDLAAALEAPPAYGSDHTEWVAGLQDSLQHVQAVPGESAPWEIRDAEEQVALLPVRNLQHSFWKRVEAGDAGHADRQVLTVWLDPETDHHPARDDAPWRDRVDRFVRDSGQVLGVPVERGRLDDPWAACMLGLVPVPDPDLTDRVTVEEERDTLDSAIYGTMQVERYRITIHVRVQHGGETILDAEAAGTDPPLPATMTMDTMDGVQMGPSSYHTAWTTAREKLAEEARPVALSGGRAPLLTGAAIRNSKDDAVRAWLDAVTVLTETRDADWAREKLRSCVRHMPAGDLRDDMRAALEAMDGSGD